MPAPRKNSRDFTGRQTEVLTAENVEELQRRATEISTLNAVAAREQAGVVDYTNGPDQATVIEVEEVDDEPIVVDEPFRTIRVNTNLEDVTIGAGNTYSFEEGRKYRVPAHIADHLEEKGIVWH